MKIGAEYGAIYPSLLYILYILLFDDTEELAWAVKYYSLTIYREWQINKSQHNYAFNLLRRKLQQELQGMIGIGLLSRLSR